MNAATSVETEVIMLETVLVLVDEEDVVGQDLAAALARPGLDVTAGLAPGPRPSPVQGAKHQNAAALLPEQRTLVPGLVVATGRTSLTAR